MSAGSPLRVVDVLAAELRRLGVTHLFGVGGANIEDLYDAVRRTPGGARPVVAKHEFSAATMADGYARTTGRLGVVAATSGGGAMNLVPGLAEAYASRIPVLALVGQPPLAGEGRGVFQDSSGKAGALDAAAVFAPVSRSCARITAPEVALPALRRAVSAALAHPRGPAVLLLPKDVQQTELPASWRFSAPPVRSAAVPDLQPPPAALRRAVEVLNRAERVLLIAGEGVAADDARLELASLADRLRAWVAVTPDAKDVFDNRHPRFAGVAGVMGHEYVAECLRRADACLLVGTRLPSLARGGLEAALDGVPVVCVDPEPPFVPGVAVPGGPRATLRMLAERLDPRPRPLPGTGRPVPMRRPPRAAPAGTLPCAQVLAAVSSALPPDAHVFVDAGNVGASAIHLLSAPRHGRFVVAVGMGGMGYTFGAGIGAALATGRRTCVIAGDGAFFMHGMEVHTAVEHDAPVTFVVLNNNAHGMCAIREELYQGGARGDNLFRPADIAAGAAAMFPTLSAVHAHSAADVSRALARGAAAGGPSLVAVDVDPGETPPFLPFLAAGPDITEPEETADECGPISVG